MTHAERLAARARLTHQKSPSYESTPPPPVPRDQGLKFLDGEDVGKYKYAPDALEVVRAVKTAAPISVSSAIKVEDPEATNPVPKKTAEQSRVGK